MKSDRLPRPTHQPVTWMIERPAGVFRKPRDISPRLFDSPHADV
jgi:hypothetical protein